MRSKNHKLNRAVQSMLFGMVERGMEGEFFGDKKKTRPSVSTTSGTVNDSGEEAIWAVIMTKDLWRKGVW
jgi:protein SDA1